MKFKRLLTFLFAVAITFSLAFYGYSGFSVQAKGILDSSESLGIFRDLSKDEVKDYYSDLSTGAKGDELLDSLQEILKEGQVKLSYDSGAVKSGSWTGYYLLERDYVKSPLTESEINSQSYATSNVWLNILYSTSDIYVTKINSGTFKYNDLETGEEKSIAYKSSSAQFDREHVLPKSFGFNGANERYKKLTAGCDIQNLHAGEHNGNSSGHSNYPYGTVANKNKASAITSGITGEIIGYTGNNAKGIEVFEPLDVDKGDIARTIFYMCARYHNYEELGGGDNTPAITLSDEATKTTTMEPEDTKTTPAAYGEVSDLLAWNKLDPVDEFEVHRNNLCYNAIQKNRNPFIDFPQWADIAYGDSEDGINLASDTVSIELDFNGNSNSNTESLSLSQNSSDIYQTETMDFSNITFTYKNTEGTTTNIPLSQMYYTVKLDGEKINVEDITTYSFTTPGSYEIVFTYNNGDKILSSSYTLKVKNQYSLQIKNLDSIKLAIEEGKAFNYKELDLWLLNKGVEETQITEYTVAVIDSNNKIVSTSEDYSFEMGDYKLVIQYTTDSGDVYNASLNLTVTMALYKLVIIAVIALIVLICIIFILYKVNKKKSRSKRTYKKTTRKTSRK